MGSRSRTRRLGLPGVLPSVLTALALLLATACGSGAADGEGTAGGGGGGEVTLTFWGSQELPQAVLDAIEAYGERAGVETELVTVPGPFEQNTLTRWTAGERPDVLFWQPAVKRLLQLDPDANLQDLSDMAFVERTQYGIAEEAGSVDGTVYTATFGFPAVFGLFYNRQVLADAGLEPPRTLDELDEVSEQLAAAGVTPVFLAGGDAWTLQVPVYQYLTDPVADGLVEQINAGEATWEDPAVVAALDRLAGLVEAGHVNPDHTTATYPDQQQALLAGEAAMAVQGSWLVPGLQDAAGDAGLGDTVGFVPMPSESGVVMWQASNLGSVMLPVTGDEAREQAARDFVDYLTGDGYQAYLDAAQEPPVLSGAETPDGLPEVTQEVFAAFEAGAIPSVDTQAAANVGDFPSMLGELLAGTRSSADVAGQLQREFEESAELIGVEGS